LKAEDRRPQMSQLIRAEIDRLKAVSQSKYWDYMDATDRSDEVAKDKATSEIAELDRKIAELNHQFYHTLAGEEEVRRVVPTNKKRKYN